MAGLRKQKQYDWKDSNLALFGSDTEKQVKKESAQQEKAWKKAGLVPGLQIWRIVKFKVTEWPLEEYGQFYTGDSYIILNTYKEEDSENLNYDVHFWIGKYSTQDEYGTAAYKTVELDTYLDDVPIQHREVQDYESDLFKSYFKELVYKEGGAETGFKHVTPEKYEPRLFHFHGDRNQVTVKEIARNKSLLDETDVYILDAGLKIYQWNGPGANKDEKYGTHSQYAGYLGYGQWLLEATQLQASQYVQKLKQERSGKRVDTEVIDYGQTAGADEKEFESYLGEEVQSQVQITMKAGVKKLFRLSDASGSLEFTLEKENKVVMNDFDKNDVFILDISTELFVWIGSETSSAERKNALNYAHAYLNKISDCPFAPVSCLKEGQKNKSFFSAVAA